MVDGWVVPRPGQLMNRQKACVWLFWIGFVFIPTPFHLLIEGNCNSLDKVKILSFFSFGFHVFVRLSVPY